MPKYIKTIVRKSNLIPWINTSLTGENPTLLTAEEIQLRDSAISEVTSLPGYVNFEVITVGNTQIFSYEFDTIENLNNFVGKIKDKSSINYDPNLFSSKYDKLVVKKIEEMGLSTSYVVTNSVDLTT
jgi:hypothetical protein